MPASSRSSSTPPSGLRALTADLSASVVVFLVALPLCMGVALASGVPEEKAAPVGILTGVIGGLVVGLMSGCPLQVSGPAAGLLVMVGQFIGEYGYAGLGLIVIVAGLVQMLAGLLRWGQMFRAVSPAVIEGMLAGIGMLILAAQLHVMVDDKAPGTGKEFGGLINLATLPGAVWKGLTEQVHQGPALLGVVTIVVILLWTATIAKRWPAIPASLVGVVTAILIDKLFHVQAKQVDVPANLFSVIQFPSMEGLAHIFEGPSLIEKIGPLLLAGLALAFVASAETLLTAGAVDSMQSHAPRTNYDRELIAQGVGNSICGMLSLIPMTGVIVRSAANVQAGGRTRFSTILHGLWLLLLVLLLPRALELVPSSSLAAVLVYTGAKLMHPKAIKKLMPYGWSEVAIFVATFSIVVGVDLLTGIVVGIVAALGKLIYTFSHLDAEFVPASDGKPDTLHLRGSATFLRLPKLALLLSRIPGGTHLHLHFDELHYIDHACLELLLNWQKQHEQSGGRLVLDWEALRARFRGPRHKSRLALSGPTERV